MAAAAAMVTIGVVKQAGQLSHRHERPSAREAACLLTNGWFPISSFRGRHCACFIKSSLFEVQSFISNIFRFISTSNAIVATVKHVFLCWLWIRAGEMY